MTFRVTNLLNRPSIKPLVNSFAFGTFTSQGYGIDYALITYASGLAL